MAGFTIKRPDDTRRSFSIHIKENKAYRQLKDPRLDAINGNLRDGIFTRDQANFQVDELVKKLKSELGMAKPPGGVRAEINAQNLKVFDKYWRDEYELKKIKRPWTAENEFLFALRAIDSHHLNVSSKQDLQKAVDKAFNRSQHKRYVGRVNALLDFLDRGFTLHTLAAPLPDVSFVTIEEFRKILGFVQDPVLRALYGTLFGTGCRLGEVFVFNSRSLAPDNGIFISKQMHDKTLEITEIKNNKPHRTLLLSEFRGEFDEWALFQDKASYRKKCQHPLTEAARKAFPDDKSKHISPHDLRHSYAIHLLSKGLSLSQIARLLGDTVASVERHYAGFVMSDKEFDLVRNIIQESAVEQ